MCHNVIRGRFNLYFYEYFIFKKSIHNFLVSLLWKIICWNVKPAIAFGCDPIPFRTWKSNQMSLLCYWHARAVGKQQCWHLFNSINYKLLPYFIKTWQIVLFVVKNLIMIYDFWIIWWKNTVLEIQMWISQIVTVVGININKSISR